MSTRLSKVSDTARRWVDKWVWVETGEWVPDPPEPPDPNIPDDPIDEDPPSVYVLYVQYRSYPNVPSSFNFGVLYQLLALGYIKRIAVYTKGTTQFMLEWYEPQ